MSNNYEFTTINNYIDNGYFNLSFILADLFSENEPIITLKNVINNDHPVIDQIELFMPADVLKSFSSTIANKRMNPNIKKSENEKRKFNYYREFTNSSNTYTLGNNVINYFNNHGIKIFIEEFDKKNITLNDKKLKDFLNKIKEFLFLGDRNGFIDSTILEKYKTVYELFLNKNLLKNILIRVIVSVIILQKQTKNYPMLEYLNSFTNAPIKNSKETIEQIVEKIFDNIWLSFLEKDNSNEIQILKYIITSNTNNKNFKFIKKICELNEEYIAKSNIEFKFLYVNSLVNCGNISNAEEIFNEEQFDNYANAQYVLYKIYNGDYGHFDTENINEKRKKALSKASNLGQPYAALIFIKELFDDNFNENYGTIKSLLTKMKNNIIELDETKKGWYYYYSGLCKEKDNLLEEASIYFDKALEYGIELARTKSSRVPRKTVDFSKNFNSEAHKNICIINSNNNDTKTLLRTLPDDYTVYSINTDFANTEIHNIISFYSIKTCIDTLVSKTDNCEKVIIAFFSDDEKENLNYGLETLDRLYNEVLNKENSDRFHFISIFDIFIKSNYDFASVFIDASISDMGDNIYFKTHIIDPYRTSIQKLLYEKPLFLPILSSNEPDNNTVLFSNNVNFSYSLLKELIAVGYMGEEHKTNATIICNKNIENELNNKLRKEMPGIYKNSISAVLKEIIDLGKNKANIQFKEFTPIKPTVIGLDETKVSISSLLCTSAYEISDQKREQIIKKKDLTNEEKALINQLDVKKGKLLNEHLSYHEKLNPANYFIIDVGSDEENIDFAIHLRRQLMANSEGMAKKPFIAVYCRDSKTAYLANRMTLSNKNQGIHWHNRYDLYFFGMSDSLYSYDSLINSDLETQALEIHKSYCKLKSNDICSKEYFCALNSFYSYQYNIDSSIATAIGLRYRLFIAQLYRNKRNSSEFSLEEDYDKSLAFEKQLKNELNYDSYAKIEQYRWNNFMLSRGWQAPTKEQLCIYLKDEAITNHKHMLLKLHPYIADWDDLTDDGDICNEIKTNENDSPRSITKDSIEKTSLWFSLIKESKQNRQLEIEH